MAWSAENGRRLFKIFVEDKVAGNRTAKKWKKIETGYNSQTEVKKTVLQMKNYYQTCQRKWKAWYAMQKLTGIALMENGLHVPEEFDSERFKSFVENNVHGSYVAKHVLPDLDLWDPVFSGRTSTGHNNISPAVIKSRPEMSKVMSDGEEHSGDSDNVHIIPKVTPNSQEPAWSRSPTKTTSSRKRKKMSDFDKAFEMIKMTEICHEDVLIEAVANIEEVQLRGDDFIAACIKYRYKEKLDKLSVRLQNDAQRWAWLKDVEV